MIETQDYNCYEFYLAATEEYGEYDAVQHLGAKYKRSEFIRDIESLAAYFKLRLGLCRGDVYTVFCPTNVESFVAFYALNKLGVIVNFVHPLLPTEAVRESLIMSKSKGVMLLDLLSSKHVKTINELGLPVLLCRNSDYASPVKKFAVRTGEGALEAVFPKFKKLESYSRALKYYEGKIVKGAERNAYDTAVYLNGGGTTGKSKTIMLSNKSINELVNKVGCIDQIQVPGEEAEIIILPLFHAFGLCVAGHMIMCNAARVIPMMQFNAKIVVNLYKHNRISGIVGIPNMFRKLMHTEDFDGPHLSNTRMMFVGGDDLSPAFMQEFNDMLDRNGTKARLRQGYGLTEVASVCCVNTNWDNKDGSIGRPLDGLRMEIWDDNKNPVPNGTIGEIVISGTTVMQGYLTESGEPDVGIYIDDEGTRWVLSGDLGYRDDDNYFWFSGRKKRVIIISGYNVYPVDIENLMDTLPFIRESSAVQGYDEAGRSMVRLYIVLNSKYKGGDTDEFKRIICEACESTLSSFSVPREIVIMDSLPHTPLEKIDFMALTQKRPE